MIGERKRDQAATGQPALHFAQDESVRQWAFLRGRERDGAILVGETESPKPTDGMEDRGLRMCREELWPSWVGERIQFVYGHADVSGWWRVGVISRCCRAAGGGVVADCVCS